MHKFFTPQSLFQGDYAYIEGEDVKHIYKVLRLEEGQEIIVNNQSGEEFLGKLHNISKKAVSVHIIKKLEVNNESNVDIALYQGLPKASKMDLIVQKASELGVNEIVPIITSRVDIVLKGEFKKLERLQRIALEACKQCKRSIIPEIKEPLNFHSAIEELKEKDLIVVPYENAENYGIKTMVKKIKDKEVIKVAIVIGPEGGFEEEEISALKEIGGEVVTLGPRILRTETAGFTAAALIQYELGDLGGNI
ncbi:16S rRNA (uracil(1498)-N(3))-methyltransferase [Clostridium polynesiense]|uniref:16S rRNA (uracil(1498)-N(3))-methyltransferase n=1 Tax=Clostridium polynesiense TaxID=1325933 RepID=UPI00058C1B0E|nr:16S rRNA (uracil(1498)-N(3))-methyltransferase [Clostridium polynesiense]